MSFRLGRGGKIIVNDFLLPVICRLLFAVIAGMGSLRFIFGKFSARTISGWGVLYGMGLFALSLFLPCVLGCRFEAVNWQYLAQYTAVFTAVGVFSELFHVLDLPLGGRWRWRCSLYCSKRFGLALRHSVGWR